jgi:tetratricopeptide (TPR) repeat protein
VLLCSLAATGAQRDWIKLITPHFELYGNTRESDARAMLGQLEKFRHVVSRFLGLTNASQQRALVFYFHDEDSFTPFKPLYGGRPRPIIGLHVEDPLDQGFALSRQARGALTTRVVFHEFTHLLTARQFRHTPLWAVEGVAEAFSTLENRGNRFDIGVAVTNHVFHLLRHQAVPLRELLSVSFDSPEYNEENRAGGFYATSWALTHYLLFARRGFESDVMAAYAGLSSTTTNRLEAFRLAFGSTPEELQPHLEVYLRGGKYTVVRQTYEKLAEIRPARVPLQAGELDYAQGRLLQMCHHLDRARDLLQRAAAAAPADPRPRAALALIAWRQQDPAALRRWVDEAVGLGSIEPFVYFLAAQTRYESAARKGLPSSAKDLLKEGRTLCERALQLDPWLAPAHHLLGVFVLAANPATPAFAAVHVREALRTDPSYKPALLTWASLQAAQGDLPAARKTLAAMLAGPLPKELRDAALRVAAEIDSGARKLESRSRNPQGRP